MHNIQLLIRRDGEGAGLDTTKLSLVVSLLILVLLGVALVAILFWLRRLRRLRSLETEAQLPLHQKRQSGHRRLTITATPYGRMRESVIVYQEKRDLLDNSCSPPASPVPEIRITFPDEVDESGKRQEGRVVVVRVGEHSVGMEPLSEDLPAYQQHCTDRFDSLDLDRIGGLKEKNEKDNYS